MADTTPSRSERIASLDIIRGMVMVLMAIDHVRVYSALPAGGPNAGIFFTRWVTHFCAPAFVFLAGTGAYIYGKRINDVSALTRYLVTRGIALVLLELTVLRLAWTFNFDYAHYMLAGVIWMLGWCMILLALVIRFRTRTIAIAGVAIVGLQQLLSPLAHVWPAPLKWIMQFAYTGGEVHVGTGGPPIAILFVIVPWIGVMMLGYAFGALMMREADVRRRWCLRIGVTATAVFLVGASVRVTTLPLGNNHPPVWMLLLAQQKYPASQLFLLMTLGPTIALIPFAERARGWFANVMATFGRVPLFYYLLHIPTIHAAAFVVAYMRGGLGYGWLVDNHPLRPDKPPAGYMWSLPLLYLVFTIVVAALYFPCRWYAGVKARHKERWLKYL